MLQKSRSRKVIWRSSCFAYTPYNIIFSFAASTSISFHTACRSHRGLDITLYRHSWEWAAQLHAPGNYAAFSVGICAMKRMPLRYTCTPA